MLIREIVINEKYPGLNPVQFGYEECVPSHSFGPCVRSHWLLHYVVSGCGIFEREGKIHTVNPGEIFVIPPYLETYYEADAKKPWHYIWIGFTTDKDLPEEFSKPIISMSGLGSVFTDMMNCHDMERGKSAYLCACLWRLISTILESSKSKADYVEKALNCMQAEYANDISVNDIAQRLNLDRSYFSVLFRSKIGVPPGQYLMNLRLEKAAELMLTHRESPTAAALSCGYPDIYHFSKAFKKKFGCSPRAYCKSKK